jgi:NitT/TauT family transport system permease protein
MPPMQQAAVLSGRIRPRRIGRSSVNGLQTLGWFLLGLAAVIALWEGYRYLGGVTGGKIPFTDLSLPVRPGALPHVWDIIAELGAPLQRGSDRTVLAYLLESAAWTFRSALVGFLIGGLVGFALGVLFALYVPLERGLMPYVIASQTVPLLAIAPMVVIWSSRIGLPVWGAVSIIAAYLTFFPVTINTLRGLRSPERTAVELMRSYAASRWSTLWKLQVPAALPYIFTALKVSATASVVGAIVGELPSSLNVGLGRALLSFSYYFATGPERVYGAVLVSALAGIFFVGVVTAVELLLVPAVRRVNS